MKEYIERKALIKELNKAPAHFGSGDIQYGILLSKDIVEKQPIADVVEITRCKDCYYCETASDGEKYCELHSDGWGDNLHYVDDDGYCSCGVRKDK